MSAKYVLTGCKTYATVGKVFVQGVEYTEDELGSHATQVDGAGRLYFSGVGEVVGLVPPKVVPPKVVPEVEGGAGGEEAAPEKKTVVLGGKKGAALKGASAPGDVVTV